VVTPRRTFLAFLLLSAGALAAGEPRASGVPNFHQVDEHVYRGAQPTPEGLKSLAKMGIKTIIDLRGGGDHTTWEQSAVEALGMHYVHIPLRGMSAPSDEDVAKALALLDSPTASSYWPVFVHCKRGKDRTGTVIACYRIEHDHWRNEKALDEARLHGMSRIEWAMMSYVLRYRPPAQATASSKPPSPPPQLPGTK
jgi:protein tyrosine/serine phosphatase